MKRLGVLSVALLLGACAAPKEMNQTWALGVHTGVGTQDASKIDRNMVVGGISGSYFVAPQVEIQGQLDGSVNDVENEGTAAANPDVDSSQWGARLLAIYNFATGGGLVPYIGIGGGVTRVSFNQAGGIDDRSYDATWGGVVGARVFLSEQTALNGGFQYNRLIGDEALSEDVDEAILFVGLTHIF